MRFRKSKLTEAEQADLRPIFRYGYFDASGYVNPMYESVSRQEFASLKIPEGTKPFKYPTEEGYIDVYLAGKETIKPDFSHDGMWLSADLCYLNFELSGSQTGKLAEGYQRIGTIKALTGEEFSLRANLFFVILVILAGIGMFFTIGIRVIPH